VVKQGEESGAHEKRRDTRAEFERIEGRIKALGVQRSEGEIAKGSAAVLARVVGDRGRTVEQISSGCSLNRKDSREACAEVAELAQEGERSREYARLEGRAKGLRKELDKLKAGSASGDPQLDALEELVGMTPWAIGRKQIEVGLSLLVALFIELGSGLGLYIATTPWRSVVQVEARARGSAQKRERKAREVGAMTLGSIEEFMLERLEPRAGGQLSGGDLFMAYRGWCGGKSLVPYVRKEFAQRFAVLASESGIGFSGKQGHGVYRDVAVTPLVAPLDRGGS
jgi:hypothetical protein